MSEEKKTTGAEDVRWDLSFLYSGLDDPQLDKDLEAVIAMAEAFNKNYRGKLSENLGDAIREYTALDTLSDKVMVYLSLRERTDMTDSAVRSKLHDARKRLSRASGEHLTFFEHEIVKLEDDSIERQAASDKTVKHHLPWLEDIRKDKPYMLSEEVESALVKRRPYGSGSWGQFYSETEADLRFDFEGEKMTLTEVLYVMTENMDGDIRAAAMKAVNDGLKGPFVKLAAQTLSMVAGAKELEDRERGYEHSMSARNRANKMDDADVEALHEAVKYVAAPLARRVYSLKAQHLGLERLRWSDRNAKMPFSDTATVSWDEALSLVVDAYSSFSPTLAGLVREMISERRIDAPHDKRKDSGAFNMSFVLPDSKPVAMTFLNYLGSNRDVMTIAHELGHGVHGILGGGAQGALMGHAPIAFAETASIFGEMVTFDFLKARLGKSGDVESELAMVMDKIDDILNTVVRQIGFSNFEQRVHGAKKKLSYEECDRFWIETVQEIYGPDGDVFTYENTEHLWSYVSHFHRPYYVYGYANGELVTQILFNKKEQLGERFEPLYLDLLRSGGSKGAKDLLAPFGVDRLDSAFWKAGIEVSLGRLVREAERLSNEHFGIDLAA